MPLVYIEEIVVSGGGNRGDEFRRILGPLFGGYFDHRP